MKTRTQAFTLIELLVVISIIALLISILLPSLAAARATARNVQCMSNMRQIMLAHHLYADINKERLTPGYYSYINNGVRVDVSPWFPLLGKSGILPTGDMKDNYNASNNALICPSDVASGPHGLVVNQWSSRYVSYGVSEFVMANLQRLNASNPEASDMLIPSHLPKVAQYRYALRNGGPRISEISRPSQIIGGGEPIESYFIENGFPNLGSGSGGIRNNRNWEWARHGQGSPIAWPNSPATDAAGVANVFYVDGHVAPVRHNSGAVVGTREPNWQQATMWMW